MAEAFTGEIRMFAGIFAPHNWSFCSGALLSISSQQALFSLLGTAYGGDGRTSFALPDMRGRIPVGLGSGPTLTPRAVGQMYGTETHTLTGPEMPVHTHTLQATADNASSNSPQNRVLAKVPTGDTFYDTNQAPTGTYYLDTQNEGGSQSHENEMPWLCINYIICLTGIYPSRN